MNLRLESSVRVILCSLALSCLASLAAGQPSFGWQPQTSGTSASLRGISVVDDRTAWASGSGGAVIRTVDGGETWTDVRVQQAGALDLRDIQALSAEEAVVMSAGAPATFFRTTNGGQTWQETFRDARPAIFFDAMDFSSPQRGVAFSDPIDGRFVVIRTTTAGQSWQLLPAENSPSARRGEAGFAASGTCLVARGTDRIWIAAGGAADQPDAKARVHFTVDGGRTWRVADTTLPTGPSRGVFSLAFFDDLRGVAVGGDYTAPDDVNGVACVTSDGGKTWRAPTAGPTGYRSAVAVWPKSAGPLCITVGRNGADLSRDGGMHWHRAGDTPYQAIGFAGSGSIGYAVGAKGAVATVRRKSS